ncbi:MAG: transcription-repair coupling factor [bacterium]|nr:MAG: transcription-repair coupling factor [bacterium]
MIPLDGVLEDLERKGSSSVYGIPPAAAAYLCACLPDPGRIVVVLPDEDSARSFASDLRFFRQTERIFHLSPTERVPFEWMIPDVEHYVLRIRSLWAMSTGAAPTVIAAPALMQPTLPPETLSACSLSPEVGRDMDRDALLRHLSAVGYRRVPVVSQAGEMAVRGGIIDLFSPSEEFPFRIELWGDEIQSIRTFDPETQRSLASMGSAVFLPVTEVIRSPEFMSRGRENMVSCLSAMGLSARERARILDQWDEGMDFPGISLFLPAIYGRAFYPTDFLTGVNTLILVEPEAIRQSLAAFHTAIAARTAEGHPGLEGIYGQPDMVWQSLSRSRAIHIRAFRADGGHEIRCLPPFRPPQRFRKTGAGPGTDEGPDPDRPATRPASRHDRLSQLALLVESKPEERVVLSARSPAALDRMSSLLDGMGVDVLKMDASAILKPGRGAGVIQGSLSEGFALPDAGITFISEADLFGPVRERFSRGVSLGDWDLPIGTLLDGDTVVHVEHGIALYMGLKQLQVAESKDDYLHLSFAGGDSLYVPVEDLAKVQRYRSSSETPPQLSKLGGTAWKRAKARVKRSLRLMADELLSLSAKRRTTPGYSFPKPDHFFAEFEASFPWTETPDQSRAIEEVLTDMSSPVPMDRLVCGDVGFGKTEVALRASYLAVLGGKQVAVLVPTTVLAQQHFQNFAERLGDFPVRVAMLSRFVSPAQQQTVLDDLAGGRIDIVIGTHRLLSDDVTFKDLGLLIVDEEHRFGVRHKEKLKAIKETMDVLTLSATPIPRTLFQAFSGLRGLSLIHTPPADRKAVHTEIRTFDEDLIRDAVNRELERGGQVYLVHNRVMSIRPFRDMVQRLVPHARIGMAHGQMGERDLEKVMVSFLKGEIDVLISTAIIESGLDIANANTLIVSRADRFGLAQLYQLRGRVGRSSVLAYAYLLVPGGGSLSQKVRKRLASLRDLTDLGSGFKLAAYDLEIRGAGNLLGEEQSGHIGAVGLDLFSQLLEQAVREATGQPPDRAVEPSVKLDIPALLPEDYLPDVGERLTLYKRLANTRSQKELDALREETADRFGRFTAEVDGLFTRMEIIILAGDLGVERIDIAGPYYLLTFHPGARISPDRLVGLLSSDSRTRFVPPSILRLDVSGMAIKDDRISYLKEILRSL